MKTCCDWALKSPLEKEYHDREWGVPLREDDRLFELLVLESMQAGISWAVILKKREGMRAALDGFDAGKIAAYSEKKLSALMQDERVIRNRLKLQSLPHNARAFLMIQEEYGNFSDYIWAFVNNAPQLGNWKDISEVPAKTALSDRISSDLKKRGFKFMGSTTVYAFLQSAGLVNDHVIYCARHPENQKQS